MTCVSITYLTPSAQGDEHLGTASIAAYLEKHGVKVILDIISFDQDNPNVGAVFERLPDNADLYGFPLFHSNASLIYAISGKIKEKYQGSKVFVGGRLATDAYNFVLNDCPSVDFVVLGDGEYPLLEAVRAIEAGTSLDEIDSIVVQGKEESGNKVPSIVDLSDLPWMSRGYLERMIEKGYGTARISTSRGCCANCSFCSHNSYSKAAGGKRWRGRDMKDVFDEIISIYNKYGIRSFTFNDGSFEDPGKLGKQRIRELCNYIIAYPVKFHLWCFLRADTFDEKDTELIQLMKKAGFSEVFIGIESGSDADLKVYNKKATLEDNVRSIKLFQDNGINVLFGFIIFNPMSTRKSLKDDFEFLKHYKDWRPTAYINRVAIYYNTLMHKECEKAGLLKQEFSYLNPMGYNFLDPDVAKIWEFIEDKLQKSMIFTKGDLDLFYFSNFYYNMLALFPTETEKFAYRFENLMNEFASVLSWYFEHIYVDFDLDAAEAKQKEFEKRMNVLFRRMNSLKINIIMQEPFKSYIREALSSNKKRSSINFI
ncbi:MAG: B12-binding domain-containing radical SAM protein [Caulobacteraceae bacterium]